MHILSAANNYYLGFIYLVCHKQQEPVKLNYVALAS